MGEGAAGATTRAMVIGTLLLRYPAGTAVGGGPRSVTHCIGGGDVGGRFPPGQ